MTSLATSLRPTISAERYGERIEAVRGRLREAGGAGLLVGPGADLWYLTGYEAMALERLTLLVVPVDGAAVLIVPRLEREPGKSSPAARAALTGVRSWEETEDPYRHVVAALGGAGGSPGGMRLFVGDRLWAMFTLRLQEAFPGARFGLASEVLRALRMHKDAEEVALLRAAARAADRVVIAVAHGRLIGRTEREIGREIVERLLAEGHEKAEHGQIVGSGPNSASPHHTASERVVVPGEPIVFDIGGSYGGYASDITRTIWVAGPDDIRPDPEFRALHDTVAEAHAAALAVARVGTACEDVDAAARRVIGDAGHGPQFLHRTGHGIGLEVHEEPYIVGGNAERLEPGMAFSVEPGIYLEGRFGARIEDIVVATANGPDVLNEAPRELMVVAG